MARGGRRCGLCPRRGTLPVGDCPNCGRPFCERHAVWNGRCFICAKCARRAGEEDDA